MSGHTFVLIVYRTSIAYEGHVWITDHAFQAYVQATLSPLLLDYYNRCMLNFAEGRSQPLPRLCPYLHLPLLAILDPKVAFTIFAIGVIVKTLELLLAYAVPS